MVHKETCIQAKLYNDVFGQENYPTVKLVQYIKACWCLNFSADASPKQLVIAVIMAIRVYCRVLNMALFASLKGATPDPLGGICTSPLKRVFQHVLFGQNKSAWVSVPAPQTRWHSVRQSPQGELSSARNDLDSSFSLSFYVILTFILFWYKIYQHTVTQKWSILLWLYDTVVHLLWSNQHIFPSAPLCAPFTTSLCALSQRHLFWRWISLFS